MDSCWAWNVVHTRWRRSCRHHGRLQRRDRVWFPFSGGMGMGMTLWPWLATSFLRPQFLTCETRTLELPVIIPVLGGPLITCQLGVATACHQHVGQQR